MPDPIVLVGFSRAVAGGPTVEPGGVTSVLSLRGRASGRRAAGRTDGRPAGGREIGRRSPRGASRSAVARATRCDCPSVRERPDGPRRRKESAGRARGTVFPAERSDIASLSEEFSSISKRCHRRAHPPRSHPATPRPTNGRVGIGRFSVYTMSSAVSDDASSRPRRPLFHVAANSLPLAPKRGSAGANAQVDGGERSSTEDWIEVVHNDRR